MDMTVKLEAQQRTDLKKSTITKIRLAGQVPAVLYGKKTENQSISVDGISFLKTMRQNGRNAIITITIDGTGTSHQVIVNDYQLEPIKGAILHIDFFEVDMKSEMDAEVQIRLIGEAPGAKEGGIVSQLMQGITVRSRPADIPEEMEIDISNLNIGDSIQIRDILDANTVQIVNDPDETVVTVLVAAAEEEPQVPGNEEPEVIGESKK
jgi:large subunit ribosomal protein L25